MKKSNCANAKDSMPTTTVAVQSKPVSMANGRSAYIQGEETAASDYTTGWLTDFVKAATLAELQEFAESVCLNGHHDDFDSVFEGVDVPFTDHDEAEDFRAGYMFAVWCHVCDRVAMMEDEARFAAEGECDDEEECEA